jgi:hypothetical protein
VQMKTTLVALTLCSFALMAVSGCNKPEAAPAPAPAPAPTQDAAGQGGQILRPSGMSAGGMALVVESLPPTRLLLPMRLQESSSKCNG